MAQTLMNFFDQVRPEQPQFIKAVAMDMWDPFIKAVKKNSRRPRSSLTCSMWRPPLAG